MALCQLHETMDIGVVFTLQHLSPGWDVETGIGEWLQ